MPSPVVNRLWRSLVGERGISREVGPDGCTFARAGFGKAAADGCCCRHAECRLPVESPADWGELVQLHDDRDVFQTSPAELPVIDIHSL